MNKNYVCRTVFFYTYLMLSHDIYNNLIIFAAIEMTSLFTRLKLSQTKPQEVVTFLNSSSFTS